MRKKEKEEEKEAEEEEEEEAVVMQRIVNKKEGNLSWNISPRSRNRDWERETYA